jgi:hypothetical protein
MGTEALIWNYRDGEPIGFDSATVRGLLSTDDADWISEHGCLRVRFRDPDDCVDIYFDEDAPETNHTDSIVVSRPITHPDFLRRVFRAMELGDVMLFYSDETTPVLVHGADPDQYPDDLLRGLGGPRYANGPSDLLHQT